MYNGNRFSEWEHELCDLNINIGTEKIWQHMKISDSLDRWQDLPQMNTQKKVKHIYIYIAFSSGFPPFEVWLALFLKPHIIARSVMAKWQRTGEPTVYFYELTYNIHIKVMDRNSH